AASVLYDALLIPGGQAHLNTLKGHGDARHFINEMFRHCKPIGATSEGVDLLMHAQLPALNLPNAQTTGQVLSERGVVTWRGDTKATGIKAFGDAFIAAIAQHRHWDRPQKDEVPA
ncbi:MAG TPA: DJ-1/PfpI family protein, partial [Tepidisphaeraceae bacterium]|nr:DJ-1/PfpI family protein [Tepidisphaeraceae bacterium]